MTDDFSEILKRGTVHCVVRENLKKKLASGKKLKIKFGIDPTGSELHLGHVVLLRKLAKFQKLGHDVFLIFGTFTGKIGDPTGKDKLRQQLSDQEIAKNMEKYLDQAGKFLDIQKAIILKNGDWLGKLNFSEVLNLAGTFSVGQMLARDMFQRRVSKNTEINLVEFFYPLMQGYDSVYIQADLEVGGTDQLFNLLAGRQIQEKVGQVPQDILTVPILEGLDGREKMSKSLDNFIGISEIPVEIFGKIMSINDELMQKYFELLTDFSIHKIAEILDTHPRDAKLILAEEICRQIHGSSEAEKVRKNWKTLFQKKEIPDDLPCFTFKAGENKILEIIITTSFLFSFSEIRRFCQNGAVKVDGEKILDPNQKIEISGEPKILQVGKKKFAKIIAKE